MDFYSSLDSRLLDRQTPTLFEILSAGELEALVSPSVRYILVHYAHKYPRYLIKLLNKFDGVNLLVRGAIEYRMLRGWNSTFIEKFYGLKRVKSLKTSPEPGAKFGKLRRLSKLQILGCLLEIVGVPYIKQKLDRLYEKLLPLYMMDRLDPCQGYRSALKYAFVRVYPLLTLLLKVTDVVFKILYISGGVKCTSLIQRLFGMEYARIDSYDYDLDEIRVAKYIGEPTPPTDRIRPESLTESIANLYSQVTVPLKKGALVTANSVLPVSIFLLKSLEWWNTSDVSKSFSKENVTLKKPPPPALLPDTVLTANMKEELNTKDANCRLCHGPIQNPAILETGYVFCYPCIYNYLQEGDMASGGRCPVTGKKLLACRWSDSLNQWKVGGIRKIIL